MLEKLLAAFASSGLSLWGPFSLLIFCGLGLPIPEDVILITAGYLGADNGHSLFTVIAFMYLGIVMGDGVVFAMGKFVGRRALKYRFVRAFITTERLARAEVMFTKYGSGVIFVGRFLPGLRAPIFFSAGFLHFSYWKFFLMDGFAALISAPLFVWMGHWAATHDTLHLLKQKVGETQAYIIIGGILIGFLIIMIMKTRGRFRSRASEKSL